MGKLMEKKSSFRYKISVNNEKPVDLGRLSWEETLKKYRKIKEDNEVFNIKVFENNTLAVEYKSREHKKYLRERKKK
jgi:hypothetical protein